MEPVRLTVTGEKILIPEGRQVVLRVVLRRSCIFWATPSRSRRSRRGGFLRQVRELGVRGEVDYAHMTEILRQRDPELLEIAKSLNREDRALGKNAREALVAIGKRGRVTEMAELPELKAAVVQH